MRFGHLFNAENRFRNSKETFVFGMERSDQAVVGPDDDVDVRII